MDDDLQQQLRKLADEASPRPGSEDVVVKRAKTKRRLVGGFAGLVLVALIGGLAGATTLLGDRGMEPAPGPEETSACVSADYDLAVFVREEDFHDKMVELEEHLRQHDAVTSFEFVSAAEAMQDYLRENPDQEGPPRTQARRSQYRVTVDVGVDPHRLSSELADLGDGAFVPALDCPPSEPQRKSTRYVFEARKGNASANGTLSIDWNSKTLCLEVQTRAVEASHLLFIDPAARHGGGVVVLTFFDPNDGRDGPDQRLADHCFTGEELDELDEELMVRLLDHPEEFRIDFHRGPEDEPGLVAELLPPGDHEETASGCEGTEPPPTSNEAGLRLQPRQEGSNEVVPIVFPDGTTAELVYPSEMSSDALTVPFDQLLARPYPAGGPSGRMIRPQIFYGGIPAEYKADTLVDCIEGRNGPVPVWDSNEGELIDLVFGKWHVLVFHGRSAQEVWARELRGEIAKAGWLVLRGGDELRIGPENDPGDANLMLAARDRMINLWVLDCEARHRSDSRRTPGSEFVSYCLEDVDIEVHVGGPPEFVQLVYENLEVRNVKRAFPLSRYTLLP